MTVQFLESTSDPIFCDYLWTYKTNIPNEDLIRDIDQMREDFPEGNQRSNRGGWQSPPYCTYDDIPYEALRSLEREVGAFVNTLCLNHGKEIYVHEMTWWANVSNRYDYNVVHNHTLSTDFIAICYPKYPEDSGLLNLVRTDGGAGSSFSGMYFPIVGEVGRVYVMPGHLLHYVEPHRSDEERYSIALNCVCRENRYHKYSGPR